MPPNRRVKLPIAHRTILRQRYFHPAGTQPTHQELIDWYQAEYGREISQSMVSRTLSAAWASLDQANQPAIEGRVRQKQAKWPLLEQALFEWQQYVQSQQALITNAALLSQAKRLWDRLDEYKDLPQPQFSNGWVIKFNKRHNIRNYRQHGEAGSVDTELAKEEMALIQEKVKGYHPNDVYNMDETALFWRRGASNTQATSLQSG